MSAFFSNIFRSLKELLVPRKASPEEVLAQSLESVRKKLPEMNVLISRARNEMVMFSQNIRHYKQEISSVKKQLSLAPSEAAAFEIQARIRDLEHRLKSKEELLENSKENYNKMIRIKSTFESNLRERIIKASGLLERARANEWKERFASISSEFDILSDKIDTSSSSIDAFGFNNQDKP